LIIIDNCSSDNTEKGVKSYNDNRIRYFKNQNNGIIAVNRNFGLKKARGEFIAFCDDDDLWMSDKLEKQLVEFEKDSRVAMVCSNGIAFNETGETGLVIKPHLHDNDFTFKSLLRGNKVINSSTLFKKSVIDDFGMMNEDPKIFGAEDYFLWIQVAKKYKIKCIDEPLIKYRTHLHTYRNKDLDIFMVYEKIYTKLYEKEVIDSTLYARLKKRLNYRTLTLKLAFGDNTVTLQTIRYTEMTFGEKTKLVVIYLLFRLEILNTLRRLRRAALN